MATIVQHSIAPPEDPETHLNFRSSLDYYVALPEGYDPLKEYGLVFSIAGYGFTADDDYDKKKLNPYLADTYNLIVAGVRYHNDARMQESNSVISSSANFPGICAFYQLPANYFNRTGSETEFTAKILKLLHMRRLFSLDARFAFALQAFSGYSSFGFMPAIDHLCVLRDIGKHYRIDPSRIIAFGSSYGGYVASLLGKYAPQTFALIVNNSGFSVTQNREVLGSRWGVPSAASVSNIDGRRYEIPLSVSTVWSIDETDPLYFSDAHRMIRSLLIKEHGVPSPTFYCHYHSVEDSIAPVRYKDQEVAVLKRFNPVYYKRIESVADLDGVLFKSMNHAMDASLRELFADSWERYHDAAPAKDRNTDFDLESCYAFPCGDKLYSFRYSESGLEVEIARR